MIFFKPLSVLSSSLDATSNLKRPNPELAERKKTRVEIVEKFHDAAVKEEDQQEVACAAIRKEFRIGKAAADAARARGESPARVSRAREMAVAAHRDSIDRQAAARQAVVDRKAATARQAVEDRKAAAARQAVADWKAAAARQAAADRKAATARQAVEDRKAAAARQAVADRKAASALRQKVVQRKADIAISWDRVFTNLRRVS